MGSNDPDGDLIPLANEHARNRTVADPESRESYLPVAIDAQRAGGLARARGPYGELAAALAEGLSP